MSEVKKHWGIEAAALIAILGLKIGKSLLAISVFSAAATTIIFMVLPLSEDLATKPITFGQVASDTKHITLATFSISLLGLGGLGVLTARIPFSRLSSGMENRLQKAWDNAGSGFKHWIARQKGN